MVKISVLENESTFGKRYTSVRSPDVLLCDTLHQLTPVAGGDHFVVLAVDHEQGSIKGANALQVREAVAWKEREGEIEDGGERGFERRDEDEPRRFVQ